MFTRYTIALAALLLIGGSSVAGAYDDAEFKNSDRYPFLEEGYRPISPNAVSAYRKGSQTSKLNQDIEDPEAKVGDRYPLLDTTAAAANSYAMRHPTGSRTAKINQDIEDPESKIADRYPLLEQPAQYATAGVTTLAKTARPANAFAATKKAGHRS